MAPAQTGEQALDLLTNEQELTPYGAETSIVDIRVEAGQL